ncbi:MAG: YXWGXW repeat-containing protein, partial [Gammaproteobacteria bacterium]|nr:YXWGXW repeat-containing protein [Gammaproteobacteria bacterium]
MRNFARALIAALSLTAVPVLSQAGLFIGVSVGLPPPALPVYVQPPCPAAGYIWIPGYWAWDEDYYWVPGTWVLAPEPGLLWTPGYWGWSEGAYLWHAGYWGPQVG